MIKAETVSGVCFGVPYSVACPANLAATILESLPTSSEPPPASGVVQRFALEPAADNLFYVESRGSRVTSARNRNVALQLLQKEICRAVAEQSADFVFLHAAVLQVGNRILMLPGYSHAGKSTLAWSLVKAGAVYYSDEYAAVDGQGFIHPFAVPIHLRSRRGGRFVVPKHRGITPVPPHIIAFTTYQPECMWGPRELRPSQTMFELIRHSINIRRCPADVLRVLKIVSTNAHGFIGDRGEVAQVVQWVSGCARTVTVVEQPSKP